MAQTDEDEVTVVDPASQKSDKDKPKKAASEEKPAPAKKSDDSEKKPEAEAATEP